MRTPAKLTAALLSCSALLGSTIIASAPASAVAAVDCTDTDLPVSGPSGPTTVHGRFCLPAGTTPDAVQLLVHGGTYNSAYWDLPHAPERYSYQRDMAAHGYATFAMDQLGAGSSGKPLSPQLLLPAAAKAVHEVVGHLRAGSVGGHAFDKVVLVGHSVGSGVVAAEAATYHDVDAVILSGITHLPAIPVLALGVAFGLQPAFAEPRFLGSDLLYFTTRPGSRSWLFYHQPNADPAVIAADEATKDQVSVPGMGTVAVFGIVLPVTKAIDVPVFQAVGAKDVLFCGVLALRDCSTAEKLHAQEAPYYGPAAKLSTYVLPEAGHSLALHRNASAYRDATRSWLIEQVGLAAEGYHPIG
ncbi:alpha/beta hydrolase [Amycolatopsis magusensis]|uniref:Pimeloyl-ACP methyl ester carboxylesterase n=1 Tax=Amycolatopsis magusensis TaxID=882444 RepID=A0ABS4PRR2_9PSEU|nr:alpha/beta hydrolase [Amycolatopsis magusensis]MBP2182102.1 pimeloyl-ACP methyl ester carboxylesterase [Amycolatopsis magusensis]